MTIDEIFYEAKKLTKEGYLLCKKSLFENLAGKDFYLNQQGKYYDSIFSKNPNAFGDTSSESFLDEIIDTLPHDASIFDGGCGSGKNVVRLIEKGFHVTAIDISQVGLDVLKNKIHHTDKDNVTIKNISIGEYLADINCPIFDVVYCSNSLQYERDFEDVIKNIKIKTKTGGYNLISGPLFQQKGRYELGEKKLIDLYHDWEIIKIEKKDFRGNGISDSRITFMAKKL